MIRKYAAAASRFRRLLYNDTNDIHCTVLVVVGALYQCANLELILLPLATKHDYFLIAGIHGPASGQS